MHAIAETSTAACNSEAGPFLSSRRGPRKSFSVGRDKGVYALFLREGAHLEGVEPGAGGLLYIGMAAGAGGLKTRCHFDASTRNHSPRKSLAVLLMDELRLEPILVPKPNSADTWSLERTTEQRLSAWMHANLEVAYELCDDPASRESELIAQLVPPLNLSKCAQSEAHALISAARSRVMAELAASRA